MSHSHSRKKIITIIRLLKTRERHERKNGKSNFQAHYGRYQYNISQSSVTLRAREFRRKKSPVDTSQTLCIRTILYIPMHLLCISILQTLHHKCIVFMQFRLNPTLFLSLLSRLRTHSFLIHEILNCFKPKTEIIVIYESKMTITFNELLFFTNFSRI